MQCVDNFRQRIIQGDRERKWLNWIILVVYINNESAELLFVNMFQNDNCYLSTHLKNSLPHGSWNICGENYETVPEIFLPLKFLRIKDEMCKIIRLPRNLSWWHWSPSHNNGVKTSRCIPSFSENGSNNNFGRPARLEPSSRLGKVGISSSVAILSRPSGVVSRISVRQEMYTAANLMVSVFEGFFSPGKSGIKSRSLSMCALRVCTRHLSRALAILLCRLTPVKRGPRLLGFFFPWLRSGFAAIVASMDGCFEMNCTHKRCVFKLRRG